MNIKELRTKEGLSQSALAKKLGIATSAIGHMENGRMKVSAKIASKVKEEFGVDVKSAESKAKDAAKTRVKKTKAAVKKAEKATKTTSAKVKASAKKVADKVVAEEVEVKKATRKTARKMKETAKKVDTAAKKTVAKAKAAKLEIVVQSPMGGNITAEEIAAKIPAGCDSVFIRVDQNKLWWIKGEETGSVDIW